MNFTRECHFLLRGGGLRRFPGSDRAGYRETFFWFLIMYRSRVLTNGSNKAFALAHTDSGFISASAFVLPPTVSPIAEEEESAAAKDVLDEKEEEEEAAPELLAEARVEDEAQAAEEDDDDDDDDDDDGLRSAS